MSTGVVIPCYNEEHRLDESEVRMLVEANVDVYLVDDGSTDDGSTDDERQHVL